MLPPSSLCPDCGHAIPADAPRGLCVTCLTQDLFFTPDPADAWQEAAAGPAPEKFGSWRVLGLAGEGAFGLVYEAQQEVPVRRKAALKVLKPGLDSREIMARFATEREALAVLDHPGIARVMDAGTEAGRPWIAAEWVEDARPLTYYAEEKQLPLTRRVRLFQQVVEAVAHAHQRGIIHRDLKPSNILVNATGEAKVIDFGIARATEQVLASSTLVTMAGQVLGTPAYMSPEQAAGQGAEVDTRSDLYALGAVGYELLTGSPVFPRDLLEKGTLPEVLRIVREEAPVRPSLRNPALRGELEWILLKTLEKEPGRRYDSAGELARELGRWLEGGTVLAAPPSRRYRLRTFLRRHHTAALGVLAVFLALLAGLAGTTGMYVRARTGEAEARTSGGRAMAGEAQARRNASRGDHQTARIFSGNGEAVEGVMHLARAVRTDPTNAAAATRLLAELVWTDFPRLAWPPLAFPEFIRQTRFSPDNSRLAVQGVERGPGYDPGIVWLLDPEAGRRVDTSLPGQVLDFAFSPDSRFMALSHPDGTVTFHHLQDGSPAPWPPLRHDTAVRAVSWGGMERFTTLEQADAHSTGRLWDLQDPSQPRLLAAIPGISATSYPAWSPDHRLVAFLQTKGTVRVLSAGEGQTAATWSTPGPGRLTFRDNNVLAVQNTSGNLQLFEAATGHPVSPAVRSGVLPLSVLASPDSTSLLTCALEGTATLWDAHRLEPMLNLPGRWTSGEFSASGGLLALGGEHDERVALLDLNNRQAARPSLLVPGKPAAIGLSPDGHWLACGGRQRQLMVFNLQSRAARPAVLKSPAQAWHAGWNADGSIFSVLDVTGTASQWNLSGNPLPIRPAPPWEKVLAMAGPEQLSRGLAPDATLQAPLPDGRVFPPPFLTGFAGPVPLAAVSPEGRWLAAADAGSALRLIALTDATPPATLTLPSPATVLAFSPGRTKLAACLTDGTLLVWEVPSLRELGRWQPRSGPALALTFLPDGRPASGGEDGSIALGPDPAIQDGTDAVRQLKVTADGRYLISSNTGGTACIRDARTGLALSPPLRHQSIADLRSGILICPAPDGKLLATAGNHDAMVRLWDIPSGRERGVLPHAGLVQALAFDPSGQRLTTLSSHGSTGVLQCWDPNTNLPLLPPQSLPDGDLGVLLSLSPDGNRAAVASSAKGVFLFDLPPVILHAPPWLPDAAEAWTGWCLNPEGLREAVPQFTLASSGTGPSGPLAPWAQWLTAGPGQRGSSPLSPQTSEDRFAGLALLNSSGAIAEMNRLRPSLGGIPAVWASRLCRTDDPASLAEASRLAWLALRTGGGTAAVAGLASDVLSGSSSTPATWALLGKRLREHPENPDTWNNLGYWLTWHQAWLPAWICHHRASAAYRRLGKLEWAGDETALAQEIPAILGAAPALLLQPSDLPPPPPDDATAAAWLNAGSVLPDRSFRLACRAVNAQPRDGAAWWMLGEAAAAIARRDQSPLHAAAAAAAYTACGADIFWIRARLDNPAWQPRPLHFALAALRFPLKSTAVIEVSRACLSRLPAVWRKRRT